MATETVETAIYRLRVEGEEQIKRATQELKGMDVAQEDATSSNRRLTQQIQRGLAAYDPIIKAQQVYTKQLELNARARESGAASEQELNSHLALTTQNYQRQVGAIQQVEKATDSHINSTKAARYEMINLSRQFQDIGVSLASGQSPFMVLIQQGSQVYDVFASSERKMSDIFKSMGAGILAFVTNPITVAIGAVTALTAAVVTLANAWDKANVSAQRAISGAGRKTGTTVEDMNAFVERSSGFSGTRLGGGEARKFAEDLAATGKIAVKELDDMSNAVLGFANQTGKSTAEASAAWVKFAKDPMQGLKELQEVWGEFDEATRKNIQSLVNAGDETAALNALMRATAKDSADAAKNMTELAKAYRLLFAPREFGIKPTGIEDQLETARAKLSAAYENAPTGLGVDDARLAAFNKQVEILNKNYEELFAKQQALIQQGLDKKLNEIGAAAETVSKSIIPQIAQIEQLDKSIKALERGGEADRIGQYGAQALTIAKAQKQEAIETIGAQARVAEEVNKVAAAHTGVSRAVAVQLDMLEKQTALAGAVGEAEKMAAQYAIDYAQAKLQGATATEAAAIADEKQKAAQAAINAQAKETLFSLQNQAAAAGAVTGAQQMAAQAAATYNQMVHGGVAATIAAAVAAQQLANAHAAATANVERQVKMLRDSTTMIEAQTADLGTGTHNMEASAAAGIAYKNAIESGASATAAAALSAETMANYAAKAAMEMKQAAIAAEEAAVAESMVATKAALAADFARRQRSLFEPIIMPTAPLSYSTDPAAIAAVAAISGGMGKRLDPIGAGAQQAYIDATNARTLAEQQAAIDAQNKIIADKLASYEQDVAKATAERNPAAQLAAYRSELGYVQGLPASAGNYQKIASLQDSIDNLIKATDGLSGSTDSLNATNQELLSPYYTQDPRTSHIGFRSQGMASGGYVDVPGGYSANDNMLATIPVASGERIYVDPMTSKRGTAGGNMTINISSPITINGNASKDEFGRTLYQSNQMLARQMRAAAQ